MVVMSGVKTENQFRSAYLPGSRVSQGAARVPEQDPQRIHEEQGPLRPQRDRGPRRQGRVHRQGAGGPVLAQKVQDH